MHNIAKICRIPVPICEEFEYLKEILTVALLIISCLQIADLCNKIHRLIRSGLYRTSEILCLPSTFLGCITSTTKNYILPFYKYFTWGSFREAGV